MDYLTLKALHIISFTAWMAGMFYLPRLYVYHTQVATGSQADQLFQTMERRLLRAIINPAMIATFVFGGWMLHENPELLKQGWMHIKLTLVILGLGGVHGMLSKYRKDFARGENRKSERFYRVLNEVPTVVFVIIVLLAVLKPF
jgi:putative membrane protein